MRDGAVRADEALCVAPLDSGTGNGACDLGSAGCGVGGLFSALGVGEVAPLPIAGS